MGRLINSLIMVVLVVLPAIAFYILTSVVAVVFGASYGLASIVGIIFAIFIATMILLYTRGYPGLPPTA